MAPKKKKKTGKTKSQNPARGGGLKKARTGKKKSTKRQTSTVVKKRAPSRRRPMSTNGLTRAEAAIMERMAALSPDDPRYQVLESALAFKASWVILGEHLNEVYLQRAFKDWGFSSFARYCTDELQVTSSTARKLVRSYQWLGEEAPNLIPRVEQGRVLPERPVPDYGTIAVMADAKKELQAERVAEDAYLALKQAALEGDLSASQLRRELREAIPEALRTPPRDPVRDLRKSLTYAVKTIDALRDWDGSDELLLQAEALRDAIAHHMPRPEGEIMEGAAA